MKNKRTKILLKSLPMIALLGSSIPLVSLSSCVTNNLSSTTNDDNTICTVKFTSLDPSVVITGAKIARVQKGQILGSVSFPKATRSGSTFDYWYDSTDTEKKPISMATPVTSDMTLYPRFNTPIKLPNCVGITAIETTTMWLDTTSASTAPDLKYTEDYGKNWVAVPDQSGTPVTIEPGQNVFLKGDNENGFNNTNSVARIKFSDTGAVNLVGNIMGLLDNGYDAEDAAEDPEKKDITDIPCDACFNDLFSANKAIKYVSDTFLPSTSLKKNCYALMFDQCSSLKLAPTLPATELGPDQQGCYAGMFGNCDSLQLVNLKYSKSLTSVSDCFLDWLANVDSHGQLIYAGDPTGTTGFVPANWEVIKPESEGTINVKCTDSETQAAGYQYTASHPYHFKAEHEDGSACKNITWASDKTTVASVNPDTGVVTGISEGTCNIIAYSKFDWTVYGSKQITVKKINPENCVSFKNTDPITGGNNANISFDFIGAGTFSEFQYSYEGDVWHKLWIGNPIALAPQQTVYIKGNNPEGLNGGLDDDYGDASQTRFFIKGDTGKSCGKVSMSGSIMGLIDDGRGEKSNIPSTYCFNKLFYDCTALTTISANFFAKATTLTTGCYKNMFSGCSGLTSIPKLPVTDLSDSPSCYYQMFSRCKGLVSVPYDMLPATDVVGTGESGLSTDCYFGMFYNCSQLTNTPNLPATIPASGCYGMMFQLCTSLKNKQLGNTDDGLIHFSVPLSYSCYQMFYDAYLTFDTSSSSSRKKVFRFTDVSAEWCATLMIFNGRQHSAPAVNTTYYY